MREVVQGVLDYGENMVQCIKRSAKSPTIDRRVKITLDQLAIDASRAVNRVIDGLMELDRTTIKAAENNTESSAPVIKTGDPDTDANQVLLMRIVKHIKLDAEKVVENGETYTDRSLAKGMHRQAMSELTCNVNVSTLNTRTKQLFNATRLFDWQVLLIGKRQNVLFDSAEHEPEEVHAEFEKVIRKHAEAWVKTHKNLYRAATELGSNPKVLRALVDDTDRQCQYGLHWNTTIGFIRLKGWSMVVYNKQGELILDTEEPYAD